MIGCLWGLRRCDKEDPNCSVRWYFCSRDGTYTHADRYNYSLESWESKIGENIRLIHNNGGLEDDDFEHAYYGKVVSYYKRVSSEVNLERLLVQVDPAIQPKLSDRANSENRAYPAVSEVFEHFYNGWRNTWFKGEMKHKQRLVLQREMISCTMC